MSALPPKADIGTQSWNVRFVPIADITPRSERSLLFDHLVGAREHRPGNGKTERLGALQVDDKLEFGRLLDRNVGRLRPAARSYHSRDGVLPRRRGDRMTTFFTAPHNVRFWQKADIGGSKLLPCSLTTHAPNP